MIATGLPEQRFVSSLIISFNTIQIAVGLGLIRWKSEDWGCVLPGFGLEIKACGSSGKSSDLDLKVRLRKVLQIQHHLTWE